MDNIKQMYITEDMKEIENVLNNNITDINILKRLHKKIDNKYQSCIKDWGNSVYGWIPNVGFCYEVLSEDSLIENLESMLYKLSSYAMGLNNMSKEDNMIIQPIFNNNNNNSNVNQLNLKINFNEIKENFENNEGITPKEKIEIFNKINELEIILNSYDSKSNKWERVKSILSWLANKSVDIGIAFLPIIYEIFNK